MYFIYVFQILAFQLLHNPATNFLVSVYKLHIGYQSFDVIIAQSCQHCLSKTQSSWNLVICDRQCVVLVSSSLSVSGGSRHFVWGPRRSSAEGAKIEAPMGVRRGEGVPPSPENFFKLLLKNGVFLSILMSKCASHVYTCIAYFHFHQYKPTSYSYARVKTSR